jgi:hypothetical protein
MVRRSSILADLECAIQDHPSLGSSSKTRLWAVFAVGEMYATRSSVVEKGFPGLHYFAKAMNILRLVSERPSLAMVEIWLLLVGTLNISFDVFNNVPVDILSVPQQTALGV